MRVEREPSVTYAGRTLPPRTFVELDRDELAMAVRQFVEANGGAVPGGRTVVQQPDHRNLDGVRVIVQERDWGPGSRGAEA